VHPIDPEKLRVFPTDGDLPQDELNTTIDQHFVPLAPVNLPGEEGYDAWRSLLLTELRRVSFRGFPDRIPAARVMEENNGVVVLETEPGIRVRLFLPQPEPMSVSADHALILSIISPQDPRSSDPHGGLAYRCEVRGCGSTAWTTKNPPNYVERSHVLLGRTVDAGRIWDVAATARYLQQRTQARLAADCPVALAGERDAAVWAAYAALLEPQIATIELSRIPETHQEGSVPQLLNVLRVCDLPDVVGMLAPRPVTLRDSLAPFQERVAKVFASAGADDRLRVD
jgi:hypothetical protein